MRRQETAAELRQQALKHEQYSRYLASIAEEKAEAEKEEAYIHGRNRAILVIVFILVIVGSFFYLTANSSTDSENKQVSETSFISSPETKPLQLNFKRIEGQVEPKQIYQKSFDYTVKLDESGNFFSITLTSTWPEYSQPVQFWIYQNKPVVVEMPSRVIELDKQFNYEYRSSDINYVVGHKVFLGLRHNSGDIEYIELPTKIADQGVLMARLLRVKKE